MKNMVSPDSAPEILQQRYLIIDILGEGGSSKTYRALDQKYQVEVAIKVLSIYGMSDWKTLELFEREAKILAQLKHPSIPCYLDFFSAPVGGEDSFCLVQELAPGKPLNSWIEAGYRLNEAELHQIATQVLKILIYLQDFTPPIIHRDIKPQNILLTESGQIYLVDFGAVCENYHLTITGGSTIVGTYGYMAPEQMRGQALLATDLYGLGTTLLYLRLGQHPSELPIKNLKIDFRNQAKFSPNFSNWLDELIEPIPEDRYDKASVALEYLQNIEKVIIQRPKNPFAKLLQEGDTIKVIIPPIGLKTKSSRKAFFSIVSLVLSVVFLHLLVFEFSLPRALEFSILIEFLLLFFLISPVAEYVYLITNQQELVINPKEITKAIDVIGWRYDIKIIPMSIIRSISHRKAGVFLLSHGVFIKVNNNPSSHAFGKYLDYPEQYWLSEEIARWHEKTILNNLRGKI
jgi:eukaryotic-like serine/threonine-protein kinase